METIEDTFIRGEVVWAKLGGYPWWPGAVVEVDHHPKDPSASTTIVKFFGENSHSILPLAKLAKYSELYDQYSRKANGNKRLRDSIKIAESILEGRMCVEDLLGNVNCSLVASSEERNELKTAISIEDQHAKEFCEIETIETSFCPSAQIPRIAVEMPKVVRKEHRQEIELESDDQQVLEQLERVGINRDNVISVLEYGLIQRLEQVDKQKAQMIKARVKKVLVRKYFSKFPSKTVEAIRSDEDKQSPSFKPSQVLVKTKRICKPQKEVRCQKPTSEIQFLCVKRLFSILRTYQLDSESSRKISVHVVERLKRRHQIQSESFQRSYLSFIEWLKERRDNPCAIVHNYDKYDQGQSVPTLSQGALGPL